MFVVRSWTPEDRPAVIALSTELQDYERSIRPTRRPGAEMVAAYMANLVKDLSDDNKDGELFVADNNGCIIGFIVCFVSTDSLECAAEEVSIIDFVVTASERGHGVGHALIQAVFGFARARCIQRVVISVLQQNKDAVAIYKALGFQPAIVTLETNIE